MTRAPLKIFSNIVNKIKSYPESCSVSYTLLPLSFFFAVPIYVSSENIKELGSPGILFYGLHIFLVVVFFLLISLLGRIVQKLFPIEYYRTFLEFCLFYVVATGFVFPVSIGAGMVDPANLAIHKPNIFIAITIAVCLIAIGISGKRRPLYKVIALFIAFNGIFALLKIYSHIEPPISDNNEIYSLSSKKNILVLSMDGLPGPVMQEVLEANPEFNEYFRGFTFFDRVASSSPATSASTVATLYGNSNFKAVAKTQEELWNLDKKKLITNRLNRSGYKVSVYGVYGTEFEESSRSFEISSSNSSDVISILNYSVARMLTRYFAIGTTLSFTIEDGLLTYFKPNKREAAAFLKKVNQSNAPNWKKRLSASYLDFLEYSENLHVSEATPVAHFLHFTHTHYPVEFDRDCQYFGHQKSIFNKNQNRNGVKEETYCALSQMASFIDKLKRLQVFENTLIVLKSDHGKPVDYSDSTKLEGKQIRNHGRWGYGRYMPFLAIKPVNSHASAMLVNSNPVLLDDLAKTLCIEAKISDSCAEYSGFDLLSNDFGEVEDSQITIFIVKSSESNFKYDTHEPISFKRGKNIVVSLHKTLSELDSSKIIRLEQ